MKNIVLSLLILSMVLIAAISTYGHVFKDQYWLYNHVWYGFIPFAILVLLLIYGLIRSLFK